MDNKLLLYQIALTLIPTIGAVQAKLLLQQLSVEEIFATRKTSLSKIEGIGEIRATSIKDFNNFKEAEAEVVFIEKHNITPLFITDKNYPQRLLNCYDSPTLLYYKGCASLNMPRIISVIGSRTHTEYGRQIADKLIEDLSSTDVLIVSGLAYGIDGVAHRAAGKNNLMTVGVMAHGMDQMYPPQHASLAKDMIDHGGVLTEFRSNCKPDKHNFPIRNRIVAGMCDATVVIETGIKGGSMITAELANGYNRDVFAFPGKVTDQKSAGCNHLIKNNKAILLTDGQQLKELMGWDEGNKPSVRIQKELFIELSSDENKLVEILKEKDSVHIDELNLLSGLSMSALAAAVLNLEIHNIVTSRPGKLYRLA